jgi:hypothetical protein
MNPRYSLSAHKTIEQLREPMSGDTAVPTPQLDLRRPNPHRGCQPEAPGHDSVARSAWQIGRAVARRPFRTPEALVVVSTDGYFDVYPPVERRQNAKPVYRGVISELGSSVRGPDGRLSVRPDSVALNAAVSVWSRQNGAAALKGELGAGRSDGTNS